MGSKFYANSDDCIPKPKESLTRSRGSTLSTTGSEINYYALEAFFGCVH